MNKFKIGDRVKVIETSFMEDKTIGATGTIVSINGRGVILVKLDKEIGSYRHCRFHNYTSDKMDLFNTVDEEIIHLNTNKMKWFYAIMYLANVIGCIVSICMCNLWLFLANFVLSIFFLDRYYK